MKKTMAVLLSMAIMLTLTPFTAFAESKASGSCGNGITWKVETTFVSNRDKLTISGTGSMNDFSESSRPPWESYKDRIGTVIIESGVDRIGAYAFYGHSNLDYIIFQGNTPPAIEGSAFSTLGGDGVIVHPVGKGSVYEDIISQTGYFSSWVVREPGHTESTFMTVKIPVAGESPDTSITGESLQYYYDAKWWTPEDPDREFDGEYQAGDDYYVIIELLNDDVYSHMLGGMIDYKNGLLPLDGFTVNGQTAELYLGEGPFELSSIEDIKIMVEFPNTADFVPVTDIRDVPLTAAVGHPHTLSGTVVPDNATYKDIVWNIKDDGGTGAELADDGKTIIGLASAGAVTVTATVLLGGERRPDPEYPDDPPEYWPYQDYTQDFEITVTAPAAPTISGPGNMTLTQGYAAAATEAFTVTGSPAPDVSVSGDSHITWNDTDKKLEIAAGLIPGDYPVTLTASNGIGSNAVFTFTLTVSPQDSGTVTGEIGYEHNDPPIIPDEDVKASLDVVVSLWENDESVKMLEKMTLEFSDDVVQYYAFSDVGDGWYTVVADSYIGENLFYTITRDMYVNDGLMVEPPEPIIFTPGKTQTILDIAEGVEAQNVAINNLPDLFETDNSGNYNPQYIGADREHLKTGGEVEFKLNVKNTAPTDRSLLSNRIMADGYSSVLFVDLTLTKTLRDTNNTVVGTPSTITNVTPALLEIVVPMTSRQTITAAYRIHENEAPAALSNGAANANEYGEYFKYDAEKNTVYLYVNQFSAYALAAGTGNSGGGGDKLPTGAEDYSGVPQTGDNSNMGLWYVMLGASVLGLAGLVFFYKRQRKIE